MVPLFLDMSENPFNAPSLSRKILDSFMAYFMGFPRKTTQYGIKTLKIPMEGDRFIEADLYTPLTLKDKEIRAKSRGLILVQGCYGRGWAMSGAFARPFAARGYTVLFASTRGTGGSNGEFYPIYNDGADGKKIVEWMRQQVWYPGSFATLGASYLGWTQLSTFATHFEDCIASAIMVAPHDYPGYYWGTGSTPLDRAAWADLMMSNFVKPVGFVTKIKRLLGTINVRKEVLKVPVYDAVDKHFGPDGPPVWLKNIWENPDPKAEVYADLKDIKALDTMTHPILLVSGWYDLFNGQTMRQYYHLKGRKIDPILVVGPWNHSEASATKSMKEVYSFIDRRVRDVKNETPPDEHKGYAKIFVTGAQEWREMPSFPPPVESKNFYLHPTKSLESTAPETSADDKSLNFTFDPANPTPTSGGPLLFKGGRGKDKAYAERDDCVVFTSPSLTEPVEIMGQPEIQLSHSTNHPYADLWVRLSEVDPKTGESVSVCEGYKALDPARDQSAPVKIVLDHCAHHFKPGTQMRIIIAGGNVPRFARNLGYEGNRIYGKEMRSCDHAIGFAKGGSKIVLPVTKV